MFVTVNNVINTEGAATEAQQCIPRIVVLHMLLATLWNTLTSAWRMLFVWF